MERVGIASNVGLDEFHRSLHDNEQVARKLSLRKENRVLLVGDLLQVVEHVVALLLGKDAPEQIRLLQHGEVWQAGVLLTLALAYNAITRMATSGRRGDRGPDERGDCSESRSSPFRLSMSI